MPEAAFTVLELHVHMTRGPAWSAAWGVVAAIFGGGAISWLETGVPGSKLPAWPAWIFAAIAAIAIYMCFASIYRRRTNGQSESSATPPHSVNVDLIPEQADDRLRLGLQNHGPADEFSAQVIHIIDPMGRTIGPQYWMIPWLEGNSTDPKRIFAGQIRMLDFARYDSTAVNRELSSGQNGTCHWWFSSVPDSIGAKYYNLRCPEDLVDQCFILVVRIMSASSEKYVDLRLRVGLRDSRPTCELISDQHSLLVFSARGQSRQPLGKV